MFSPFVLLLAIFGMAFAAPIASSDTADFSSLAGGAGVILCPEANGGPDCTFQKLQPGVCLRLPCKSGKCERNMNETWKTFFLNPGTVCTLHVADNCNTQGIMRADSIFFPGTPDVSAWGRNKDRGYHGSEVTYLAYKCFGTGP